MIVIEQMIPNGARSKDMPTPQELQKQLVEQVKDGVIVIPVGYRFIDTDKGEP